MNRETFNLWYNNSNLFIKRLNEQYNKEFGVKGAKIGTTLRIRLPSDFTIVDIRPEWLCVDNLFVPSKPAIIGVKEAVVLGAAAVLINNPIVSRRFWSGWKC